MEILLTRPFRPFHRGPLELLVLAREIDGIHWLFDVPAANGLVYPPLQAPIAHSGPHGVFEALDAFDLAVALRQPISDEPLSELEAYREPLQRMLGTPGRPPLGRNALGDLIAPPEQASGREVGGPHVSWLAERLPRDLLPGWFVTLPGGNTRWHGPLPGSLDPLQRALRAPWARLARERGTLIVEARIEESGAVWLIDLVRMGRFGPEHSLAERRLALGEIADAMDPRYIRLPEVLPAGPGSADSSIMLRRLDAAYDPEDPRACRVLA